MNHLPVIGKLQTSRRFVPSSISTHHNVDLPPADGEVLVVVDAHPLERELLARAAAHQEHDGEPALRQHILPQLWGELRLHCAIVQKTRNKS